MKLIRGILILALFLVFVGVANAVLVVNSASGSAGIKYFRTVSDTISFNITSSNESIMIDGESASCTCDKRGLYYCVCDISDEKDMATAAYLLTNGPGDSTTASLKVDNSIGNINNFDIASSNGNATLTYTLTDTGYNGNADCSGLGMLEVFVDGSSINLFDINSTGCTATGTAVLNVFDSGTKDVYLSVTDRVGNTKESAHKNITIDVTGPEISNVQILYYGEELDIIAKNADFPVDIYFDVMEDALSSINADLSGIHTNPAIKQQYKNINVPVSSCYKNTTEGYTIYNCRILAKVLRVSNPTINMTFKADDVSGIETVYVHEKTFTIDDVMPEAMITTDYCATKCYVKNGMNRINIQLTKQNFDTKQVYFSVGDWKGRVSNCTGGDCFGIANVNCNSGIIKAYILTAAPYKSRDDSGNPLPPYSVDMTCDNTPPLIKNVTIEGNEFGGEIITAKSELKIKSVIFEADSESINATASFGKMKNATEPGQCTKNATSYVCEWTVRNIEPGYYDTTITVNVTDIIGQMASKSISVRVLGIKSDNLTPDNLAISLSQVSPSGINRITLDMATRNNIPFFVFAKYSIRAWKGKNVKMLSHDVNIDQCIYVDDKGNEIDARNIFSEIKLADKTIELDETGRMDMIFGSSGSVDANSLADNFKIYCNITAFVQEDKFVYELPQMLTLEIPLKMRNSKLGTPGQAFVDKIKDAEDGFLYKLKILGLLNSWFPKLQQICRINDYLNMAQFAGTAIGIAGDILTPVIGTGMRDGGVAFTVDISSIANCLYGDTRSQNAGFSAQLASSTRGSRGIVNYRQNTGDCTNLVRDACNFLGCRSADKFETEYAGKPMTNLFDSSGYENIMKNVDVPDVSNSIYFAATTQCWPAVVYNVNKWRQIECGYVYCLKEASLKATDISVCDTSRNIQICSLVAGQVFETFEPLRIAKNIGANIADLLNNIGPLAAVSIAHASACGEYMDMVLANEKISSGKFTSTEIYLCQIPLAVSRFVDYRMRTTRATQFQYPMIPDMCEIAQCIGEKNCNGRKDIWETLGGIQTPTYDQREYDFIAGHIDEYNALRDDKKDMLDGLSPGDLDIYRNYNGRPILGSDGNYYYTVGPGSHAFPVAVSDDVYNIMQQDTKIDVEYKYVKCGRGDCGNLIQVDGTPVDVSKLSERDRQRVMQLYSEQYRFALSELDRIDAALEDPLLTPAQRETLRQEKQKHLALVNPTGCKGSNCVELTSEQLKEIETELDFAKTQENAKQLGNALGLALDILYANHMLDWMMTGSWSDALFRVAQFFDPDRWINNLCNPQTRLIGPSTDTGNVVACDAGICRTVLTMAGEKQFFQTVNNSEYYMYTVAIYAGPVYYSDIHKEIKYNVLFKSNSGQVLARGYRNDQLLKENMINQIQEVFLHVKEFDKMCITFSESFPPKELIVPFGDGKREYCRDIKEVDFNTGGVYVEEDGGAPPINNRPNTAPQTRTGQNPGEPGVFEQ